MNRRIRFLALFLVTLGVLLGLSLLRPSAQSADLEVASPQPDAELQVETITPPYPFIWWEAEQPAATNFPDSNPFSPANDEEAAVLSDGEWISVEGEYAEPLYLEYAVEVPDGGDYYFYARKFWQHGPFRWQWDGGAWQETGNTSFLMDEAAIREFVEANWVPLGQVAMTPGSHRLRVELVRNEGAAAFDCFALTQRPMAARGKLQPDQRYTADMSGWVVFDPVSDPFTDSPLDLRSLNEPTAGSQGWIQAQEGRFVHERTGEPLRIWGVNVGPAVLPMDDEQMAQMARFLAKQGVNMVRFHGRITPEAAMVLDEGMRDRLFALVAALKQEGIYTKLSLYFPLWYNLEDFGYDGQHPFGLIFFNPDFQAQYQTLWRDLLTSVNPYTGLALKDDPAVAIAELVNEDSLFFWTFDPESNLPEEQRELLERQFADWLMERDGSLDLALSSWGNTDARVATDRVAVWSAGAIASEANSPRAQATAQFLADRQTRFFTEMRQFLKEELGYGGLVLASNWITADARTLGALDKYTNTVGDLMDRHGYFGGMHEGERASYALSEGDRYQDQSALLLENPSRDDGDRPLSLPFMDVQYDNKPSIVSEINWSMPNYFRADFPVLLAAYGSLQETDGFFFFATNVVRWDQQLGKFAIASPVVMGQFPATALIYRQGRLQAGPPVVTLDRPVEAIQNLQGVPVAAPENLDALRETDLPTDGEAPSADQVIDPTAFLVGQVQLNYTEGQDVAQIADLSTFHDRTAHQIRSNTRELTWDYDGGLLTLNAPTVKGAVGFLAHAETLSLAPLTLTSDMDYGSILLVSLDNEPLDRSRSMLLQVMSADENFGWQVEGTTEKTIQSVGTPPLVVRELSGTLNLARPDASALTVTALDANGYPVEIVGNAATIQLAGDRFYYWITAE
ncbi:hypothetical protein [Vacuolonema iberomarrocanum]|uniref:hypothetical protein n=1 Tax=Vacuolonema iberomarrocanum TaxID=3454632 RepID=UPI001A01E8C4|nr:hypothetical protein [filamentous cyanobacterium LEGE 07170]